MHREEQSFTIELRLLAEFDDAYEGDDDGFAWYERFQRSLRPQLERALADAVRGEPGVRLVAAPRGKDPDRVLSLELRFGLAQGTIK